MNETLQPSHDGRFATQAAWTDDVARAYAASHGERALEYCPGPARPENGFVTILEPLVSRGLERLRRELASIGNAGAAPPFERSSIEGLFLVALRRRLVSLCLRTMVLELNVARLQGLLDGATPQERFARFVAGLADPDVALAILAEYPVLARQAVTCIDQWVDGSVEFARRLTDDWEAIRATFELGEGAILTELAGEAGDGHRGGRNVMIAGFSSGARIVYKPRSLRIDVEFQHLLAWIDERTTFGYRTLKVLERAGYGWVEHVASSPCSSESELRRFYERQGGYVALLYALKATDFHFENVIAAGDQPMLVDLEALFRPSFASLPADGVDAADADLENSVLAVGLLPQRVWPSATSPGIDISGLGGAEQMSSEPLPRLRAAGTDEMQFTREHALLPGCANRPSLDGVAADPARYTAEVARGFETMYRFLLARRSELLSDHGPVARCAAAEVRCILRDTQTYAKLLRDATHPDVLRDARERDRLFERLWLGTETAPHRTQLVNAELADLRRGDIPAFTTFPGSRDLWTAAGQRLPDTFARSGLDAVRERFASLGEDDFARQAWYVRASLATLVQSEKRAPHPLPQGCARALPADYLATACALGEKLAAQALVGPQGATWMTLRAVNDSHWTLGRPGGHLYDGLAGITLFLAYLGSHSGRDEFTSLAERSLETLRRSVAREPQQFVRIGAFDGWGGLIYTYAHLAALWGRSDLAADAENCLDAVESLLASDVEFDVVAGAAGCILGLLSLHRVAPSERTLRAARRCGDHLLAHAQKMPHGIGWIPAASAERPLSGYSHGAAGIAQALFALATATGAQRFELAARAAVEYERSLFDPQTNNWLDLRDLPGAPCGPSFMATWCHGAPGIAVARIASLHAFDGECVRAEIDAALRTTEASGFGRSHSLCHGDLGNLETLLTAAHVLGDPGLQERTAALGSAILASIRENGPLCGNPMAIEAPGLMTGMSGIGYALLRLAEPGRIPSVLALAPPHAEAPSATVSL